MGAGRVGLTRSGWALLVRGPLAGARAVPVRGRGALPDRGRGAGPDRGRPSLGGQPALGRSRGAPRAPGPGPGRSVPLASNWPWSTMAPGHRRSWPLRTHSTAAGAGPAFWSPRSTPGELRWAAYSLPTSRRGVFELGPLQLELSDPFGLTRVATIGCPTSTLTVHPKVEADLDPGLARGAGSRHAGAAAGRRSAGRRVLRAARVPDRRRSSPGALGVHGADRSVDDPTTRESPARPAHHRRRSSLDGPRCRHPRSDAVGRRQPRHGRHPQPDPRPRRHHQRHRQRVRDRPPLTARPSWTCWPPPAPARGPP